MSVESGLSWQFCPVFERLEAETPIGKWRIGQPDRQGLVPVGFQFNSPAGESSRALQKRLELLDRRSLEHDLILNQLGFLPDRHCDMPSIEEAKRLIAIADTMPAPAGYQAELETAGFRLAHRADVTEFYELTFGPGAVHLSVRHSEAVIIDGSPTTICLRYQGRRAVRWTNLFRITTGIASADQKTHMRALWPPSVVNPAAGLRDDFVGTATTLAIAAAQAFANEGGVAGRKTKRSA